MTVFTQGFKEKFATLSSEEKKRELKDLIEVLVEGESVLLDSLDPSLIQAINLPVLIKVFIMTAAREELGWGS